VARFLETATEAEDQVESGFLLDVVVTEGSAVLELLSSEDESLLIRGNSLLVLDFLLHVVNGVGRLDIKGDCLASQRLNEDLHSTTEAEDQVESGFLLDVVVTEGSAVLELLSSEDETLLIRGNSLLVLDFLLHVVNGVRRLDIKGDCLASQRLYEDLHAELRHWCIVHFSHGFRKACRVDLQLPKFTQCTLVLAKTSTPYLKEFLNGLRAYEFV